jgi:hypothetical protein
VTPEPVSSPSTDASSGGGLPSAVSLPDLSGLRSDLLGNLTLGLIFGMKRLQRGPVNFLVPEFVRTVEQAFELYEKARENLEQATRS